MNVPVRAVVGLIRLYQLAISPLRPPSCRYTPSCSSYAMTAVERFGLLRGGWLALRRLGRCHPWHRGGHDPVPPAVETRGSTNDLVATPARMTSAV